MLVFNVQRIFEMEYCRIEFDLRFHFSRYYKRKKKLISFVKIEITISFIQNKLSVYPK